MKRRLFLLRHAKAQLHNPDGDAARSLGPRGREEAARIGRFLSDVDSEPSRILVSTAMRARETVELAAAAGGWTADVVSLEQLYLASPEALQRAIAREGGDVERLLLCAHEPGLSQLASRLLGHTPLELPTAGLVHIDFRVSSWAQIAPTRGVLHSFVRPSLLP